MRPGQPPPWGAGGPGAGWLHPDRPATQRHGPAHDARLAAAVTAITVTGTALAARGQPDRVDLDLAGWLLCGALGALLAARSLRPRLVLVLELAGIALYLALGYPLGPVFAAPAIALVHTVKSGRRRLAWAALAIAYAGCVALDLVLGAPDLTPGQLVGIAAWSLVALGAAEAGRGRQQWLADMQRARAEEDRRRISDERLRIARELHDVVAHNISLINVQAATALHLLDERPEQARTALTAIKAASHEALQELRATLGVLRRDDEQVPRAPSPGLDRLDELAESSRGAGLPVAVRREGEPRPVPARLDLAAYRIVQESLTNVRRHGAASQASVTVGYGDDGLLLTVDDDGRGAATGELAGGHGVRGMRERAESLGGTLTLGPAPSGGLRVRAELPWEPS